MVKKITDDTRIAEYLLQKETKRFFFPETEIRKYLGIEDTEWIILYVYTTGLFIQISRKVYNETFRLKDYSPDGSHTIFQTESNDDGQFEIIICDDQTMQYDEQGNDLNLPINTFGEVKEIFNRIIEKYIIAGKIANTSKRDLIEEIARLKERITTLESR